MLDPVTEEEVRQIQLALRTSVASEAVRFAVRRMTEMMQYSGQGACIKAVFPDDRETVILDVPALNAVALMERPVNKP